MEGQLWSEVMLSWMDLIEKEEKKMGPKYQVCVSFHILKKFEYNCTTRTDCLIELKIKADILIVYVCFMWGFQKKPLYMPSSRRRKLDCKISHIKAKAPEFELRYNASQK